MNIDRHSGWVAEARAVPSPNCDRRPPGSVIDLLVIHGISLPPGEYGGGYIDAFFSNCLDPGAHPYFETIAGLRVSAHALIARNGELIQYVSFHDRAWHAGVSAFRGRRGCNDFSIGIELEGSDYDAYAAVQYEVLVRLAQAITQVWPGITADRIVGHSTIAPGRKTDPGPGFDWERFYAGLRSAISHP